jgi:hypothetical protein
MKLGQTLLISALLPICIALGACSPSPHAARDGRYAVGGADAGGSSGSSGSTASGGTGSSAGGAAGGGSGGVPDTGVLVGVETPGANCAVPQFPAFAQLTDNAKFPDPFKMFDGTPVTTAAQWVCRNRELSAMLQRYETGQKTAKPAEVTGSFSGDTLTINVSDGAGKTGSFMVTITYPSGGSGPFPAMVGLDGGSLNAARLRDQGVATISISTAPIRPENSRTSGTFTSFTGQSDAGSLIAWAWGVSRLIDALEVTPEANIKADRLGITGCSRLGKGALMVGVMDGRIALTIPQESGAGGVAAWRAAEYENQTQPQGCENPPSNCVQKLSTTYTEQQWFGTAIAEFGNAVDRLPVDHHELIALAAPRGLLALGNIDWRWLGRYGSVQGMGGARKVYEALGVADNIGFAESNHFHCNSTDFGGNEQEAIDAFVAKFLLDMDVSTAFWSNGIALDEERWIDWTTPTFQ